MEITTNESQEEALLYTVGDESPTYLEIQAETGISKHMCVYRDMDTLYRLCLLLWAQRVLKIGCGIGIGPVTSDSV